MRLLPLLLCDAMPVPRAQILLPILPANSTGLTVSAGQVPFATAGRVEVHMTSPNRPTGFMVPLARPVSATDRNAAHDFLYNTVTAYSAGISLGPHGITHAAFFISPIANRVENGPADLDEQGPGDGLKTAVVRCHGRFDGRSDGSLVQ